ncbi:hypothetical protein TWF694_000641 [Orbilia ellipsospora]|uniref:Alpha-1,2-mannosyltransferase n=1 Tax=Orbilia ellipsospora TaxID=2528407 RepID=A0AAV9XPB7_9PEZI
MKAEFWEKLYGLIEKNDPNCTHVANPDPVQNLAIGFNPAKGGERPDLVDPQPEDIERIKEAHSSFVGDLRSSDINIPYERGTRGIALTASLEQVPVLLTSIRMIRKTKSKLPIEVFLKNRDERDDHVCDVILPSLNAACILLSDIFESAKIDMAISQYQFKIMPILFSSFEDVLLLDCDSFPVTDPLRVFKEEPFRSTGMIVWPDFWQASESPHFFEVIQLDRDELPSLNVRASVESGQLMYSKAKHSKSIMLATYYNHYGPAYYYPLMSQGAPGQGDKETFAWAAMVFEEPFYAVRQGVQALGRFDSKGDHLGSAMVQHNPIIDYSITKKYGTPHQRAEDPAAGLQEVVDEQEVKGEPAFVHANFPKFDPSTIFDISAPGPTRDSNGTDVRCWTGAVDSFGFDVERGFWEEIMVVACSYEHKLKTWKNKEGICDKTKNYWRNVFDKP